MALDHVEHALERFAHVALAAELGQLTVVAVAGELGEILILLVVRLEPRRVRGGREQAHEFSDIDRARPHDGACAAVGERAACGVGRTKP